MGILKIYLKKIFVFLPFFLVITSIFFSDPNEIKAQTGCPPNNHELPGASNFAGAPNLIPFNHQTDSSAPQFSTLVEGEGRPEITSTASFPGVSRPIDLPDEFDYAPSVGFACNTNVLVPQSGYGGVTVLYADSNRVVLKYGTEDDVYCGYTLYLSGFNVNGDLVTLYNSLNPPREELPRIQPGSRIGSCSGDVRVTIRDRGDYWDPRWEYDWWRTSGPASGRDLFLNQIAINCECDDIILPGGPDDPYGALPNPRPTPIPCNEIRTDEFHSLRPYQASPCNQNYEDLALFCGNDFMMSDTIVIEKIYYDDLYAGSFFEYGDPNPEGWEFSWDFLFGNETCAPNYDGMYDDRACMRVPPICEAIECIPQNGTETCEFTIDREVPISIDLDGSELPIMGYTEPSEGTSDPYEVINLLNNRETLQDPEKVNEYVSWYLNGVIGRAEYGSPSDNQIVNFSGPLKRLLAFDSQITERIDEIESAGVTRHDQIVEDNTRISYWEPDSRRPPVMSDYDDSEEYLEDFEAWRSNPLNRANLFSYIPFSSTEDRKGMVILSDYSVQPVSPEDTCIICAYITDQIPADLFFAHMQESVELADILQQIHSPQEADLDEGPLNVQENDYALCNIAEVRRNPGDNLFPTGLSATIEYTADIICDNFFVHGLGRLCAALEGSCVSEPIESWSCQTYYNQVDCPDDFFCGVGCTLPPPGCIPQDLPCRIISVEPDIDLGDCCVGSRCTRTADCEFFDEEHTCLYCDYSPITEESWVSYDAGTCTRELIVSFQTQTHTPLATEAWTKLVSGPYGAFRRIFPQIEDSEGRPIRRLWDIPTETDVQFNVASPFSIVGGSTHQIYFPHIGGIHEYFLNCMQKTLRPQGFGQGCVSAPELSANTQGGGQTYWCPAPVAPPNSGQGCCTATYHPDSGPGGSVMFCIDDAGDVWLYNNTDYFSRDPNIEGACQWFGVGPHDVAHVCYGYFPDPGSYFGLFLIEGPTPNQLSCTVIK